MSARIQVTALLVYGGLGLLVGGCDKIESRENAYSSYAEVQATGNKGMWIPPYLPNKATDIREYHHVDSPSVWVAFNPTSESRDWPEKMHCRRMREAPEFPSSNRIPTAWWPKELTAEREKSGSQVEYRYYKCPGDLGGFLAITAAESETAFFWR